MKSVHIRTYTYLITNTVGLQLHTKSCPTSLVMSKPSKATCSYYE